MFGLWNFNMTTKDIQENLEVPCYYHIGDCPLNWRGPRKWGCWDAEKGYCLRYMTMALRVYDALLNRGMHAEAVRIEKSDGLPPNWLNTVSKILNADIEKVRADGNAEVKDLKDREEK